MGLNHDVNADEEVFAISTINAALTGLRDPAAKQRVLDYVLARHLHAAPVRTAASPVATKRAPRKSSESVESQSEGPVANEIPRVARLMANGDLRVLVRDVKARSKLNAAVRMAHIAIYAYEKLAGAPLQSRTGLTPVLKSHRLYDGNTRSRIAKEPGIVRDGDQLTLDDNARQAAEKYIGEALDASVEGKWKAQ
jgi:hypothetical protein